MSRDWTPNELAAASAAMKARGEMGYEEFCAHLELCAEKVVVVRLSDGDTITTRIHGTDEDIRAYYKIGSVLNTGTVCDRLVTVAGVDILDAPGNTSHGPVHELQQRGAGIGG